MPTKTRNLVVIACTVIMTVIAVGGIIYACGAVTGDIQENKEDIAKVELKAVANEHAIHEVELTAKDIKALAATAANASIAADRKFEVIQKRLTEQATIQAVNSTKLESLTKD